jgi:PAS domain-containing protein
VLDLVERVDCFLPTCDLETGEWESFNSRAVAWIGLSRASDADGSVDELFQYRRLVRVALVGGGSLEGEVLYSAPDGEARLVDFLNRRERFFRLWDGDRVFLVNKDSVLRVVENGHQGE